MYRLDCVSYRDEIASLVAMEMIYDKNNEQFY